MVVQQLGNQCFRNSQASHGNTCKTEIGLFSKYFRQRGVT